MGQAHKKERTLTATSRISSMFNVLQHQRRRILHFGVSANHIIARPFHGTVWRRYLISDRHAANEAAFR
jgi:hypothetical protein